MDAALIAVGTELLHTGRPDTNGDWLADRFQCLGIRVRQRALVEDDPDAIASVIASVRERCDVVVLTGGLGPTEDDLTREGVARALSVRLVRDPDQERKLRRRFEDRGRRFRGHQARQAERPEGATWLENPMGTAPGFRIEVGGVTTIALPGVPAEMKAIFESHVDPPLRQRVVTGRARRTIKIAGRFESYVDRAVRDLYAMPGTTLTILARVPGIELLIMSEAENREKAVDRLEKLDAEIVSRLGADIFGRDDDTLAEVVGRRLSAAGKTLATAESCTAGMLSGEITRVPGSSAWFRGGLVVYRNDLKISLAGVSPQTLEREGAVSRGVALELARGARERCLADVGVGITGIAGPGGATKDKPVGLVHLALDDGTEPRHWAMTLPGDRDLIRGRTVTLALDKVRRHLAGSP